MHVPFDHLPAAARVWVYQVERPLTPAEAATLEPALRQFADEWTSHGRNLAASAALLHGQFLVIGLDEAVADASGCSIDASVRFVGSVEERFQVSLLDKSKLAFLLDGAVHLFDRRDLRAAVTAGTLTPDTPYFNNTLGTLGQLRAAWPAPAGTTWLARYFQPAVS